MRIPHATLRTFWQLWLSLAAWAVLWSPATGQSLLDYVGSETGFCLHLDRVSEWSESLAASPLVQRLERTPLIRKWKAGDDFTRMRQNLVQLELLLGGPLDQTLRDLIGRELVLAVDPHAPGQPAGILLTAPTNRGTVERVLTLWSRLESAATTVLSGGYVQRTVGGQPPVYYYLRDDLFAISDRESLIREIASFDRAGERHPRPMSSSAEWLRAKASLAAPAWGSIYFRPRLWDGVLPRESNAPVVGPVLRELAQAESLMLGVDGRAGLHWELSILFSRGEFPAALQHAAGDAAALPRDWAEVSETTLFAVVGQGDPRGLAKMLRDALPRKQLREWNVLRQVLRGLLLDRDPLEDVLPQLGPAGGVRLVADENAVGIPLGLIASLEFRPDAESASSTEPRAELSRALDHFLKTTLQIVAAQLDSDGGHSTTLQVEESSPGAPLRWLEGLPFAQPAYVVTSDRVLLATSPALLRSVVTGNRGERPATKISSVDRIGEAGQIVFFNVRATRAFLARHREKLPGWLQVPREEAARAVETIRQIEETLAAVDEAYFAVSIVDEGLRLRVGLQSDAE